MLTQYIHQFINNFDQKKTIDQIQSVVSTKEGMIGLATAALLVSGTAIYKASKVERGCPQVPSHSFFMGSTLEYRKDPGAFVTKWEKKLGRVYGAYLFGQYATVVSGPQVREVFCNNDFDFVQGIRREFDVHLLLNSGRYEDLPTHEVSTAIKNNLNPKLPFYTGRVIEHLKIGLKEQCGVVPDEGKEFDHVYPLVQHMVAKASASIIVGPELAKNEQLIDSFKNMVLEIGPELGPTPYYEYFPRIMRLRMWLIGKLSKKVRKHQNQLHVALRPEVERRVKAMKENDSNWDRPNDFLQDILDSDGCPPHVDIIDHCRNWMTQLIFAALHTTSENGTLVFYRLLDNPEVMEELLEEQNQVLKDAGYDSDVGPEVFNRDILNKLVKLDSVIRESCRLRNDYIALPHKNISNKIITLSGGAMIRPGEHAFICRFSNHRDENLHKVSDDIATFNPYRFVNQDTNSTKGGEDFLFFGMGKHACPGRWFAIQEIKTIVSMMIRSYRLSALSPITFPTDEFSRIPWTGRFKIVPRK